MNASPSTSLFKFESSDSLAQFTMWIVPVAGGGVIGAIVWDYWGIKALALIAVICVVLVAGLRSSISVSPGKVTILKKWFFVPYMKYTATCIEDVSFGGDYGLEEGAMGVIVKLGGKEVHIGTSKNMHHLYESLRQVTQGANTYAG